jgi:AcrR family transcriptional regulator
MPAIIDHDARRAFLAEVAADLVASEGIEAATVRAIAKAAGYSTKVVSHYFADKRALLMMTYRFAADRSARRSAPPPGAGSADAMTLAASLLPIGPEMARNWRVWLAFWAFAISDEAFAAEQRAQVARARGNLVEALARDPRYTQLTPKAREAAAAKLITLVIGVAVQAAFDPADWPETRQAEPLIEALGALAGAAPRPTRSALKMGC